MLADLTWTAVAAGSVLALPVGSCEQHGPHLPLGTDTVVATALVAALAERRPGVLAAPALPFGASGEHAGFGGTLSLGTAALEEVVVELVRSADHFAGVVVVSGHGGNAEALRGAAARCSAEGRRVMVWAPSAPPGGDAHAGRVETSLLLHLAPHLVGPDRPIGATAPLATLMPALRAGGVVAVSPTGVLGDATGATADEGARLLAGWVADLVDAVGRFAPLDRPAP